MKTMIVVAALYKFTRLDDYKQLQEPLKTLCVQQGIKGTLLLAQEGINGTVAGSREAIDVLSRYCRQILVLLGGNTKSLVPTPCPLRE